MTEYGESMEVMDTSNDKETREEASNDAKMKNLDDPEGDGDKAAEEAVEVAAQQAIEESTQGVVKETVQQESDPVTEEPKNEIQEMETEKQVKNKEATQDEKREENIIDGEKGKQVEDRTDVADQTLPTNTTMEANASAPGSPLASARGRRGRKRKSPKEDSIGTPAKATPRTPRVPKQARLSWKDFLADRIAGDRVLSCGEGDQIGHPGRTTTKKPRKIDIIEEKQLSIVQVTAGGVHSLLLSADGIVYTCGINEKGTVPGKGVEMEGSTDMFVPIEFSDEIQRKGKIVQLTAGASFSAALTDAGSVIAWGNLRDSSGLIEVHPLLSKMKETPVIVVHHENKIIAKIAAGENHLAMLSADGELLTFGDGTMGQLGRSVRANHIRSKYMCNEKDLVIRAFDPIHKHKSLVFSDVFASGFWTMGKTTDGRIFSFGLNNYSQLGVPMKKQENTKDANTPADATEEQELRILLPTYAPVFGMDNDWVSIEGVQHVIARSKSGLLFALGRNVDNALGLGTFKDNDDPNWKYDNLQKLLLPDDSTSAGCTAKLTCSIAWNQDGKAFAWGCDTSGQLGLGLTDDDEKVVPKPELITSAHLEGYKILMVSIADNHALFLAKKQV